MIKHRFITLPNLVLGREVVPELLQERATPEALAAATRSVDARPVAAVRGFRTSCATALGPPDALERCARFAVALARGGRPSMIRIYHTSDLHDQRGFARALARAARAAARAALRLRRLAARKSNASITATSRSLRRLDAAGYDAQSIGNREFHYLFGLLRARAARMHHPLVCTNLRDTKGRPLPFRAVAAVCAPANGERVPCTFSVC